MKLKELKREAYEANCELPRRGLVLYAFGNASALDRASGLMAIKPSGVSYDKLSWKDMVVLDLAGRVIDGRLSPSSDTKTHLVLYKAFPMMGGVVHTHSTHATAWAQAGQPVPILGTTHADHLACDIPCTEFMPDGDIAGDYETATGRQILRAFEALSGEEACMVLVAGHGPFTWGKTAAQAVYNSVVLEELCRMAFLTLQVNPSVRRLKPALVEKHFQRKHGSGAYYGQKGKA